MTPSRVVIACGGTGGHFFPGYALGRTLRSRGAEVLFVLRKEDPAARRLAEEDLPFVELDLHGLPRRPSLRWLSVPWKLACSLRLALSLIRDYRPAVAVGMGGYLTLPVALAARLRGVPYVLHESNAVLGLANRLAARGSRCLALGLPLRDGAPRSVRTTLTGTPIREPLWEKGDRAAARKELGLDPGTRTLLVFGGSQGALALNRALPGACARLLGGAKGPFQVLHLSGPRHEAEVRAAYGERPTASQVRPSLDGMAVAFAAADLAVCRSGASSVAELVAQRMPAVLVPYPGATGGHQEANARILERCGAAEVMLQTELSPEALAPRLAALLFEDDGRRLSDMSKAYGSLRLPAPSASGALLADIVQEAGKRYS